MNLIKDRGYPIRRDGKVYWVSEKDGDYRVMREVKGGATASTPSSQAQQAKAVLDNYLSIAPDKYYAIYGTIPAGSAGGSTAQVTWQQQIPIVPAFCTAIDYEVTLPVTLTLGATSGSATLSPFAPYCAISNQFTLGGAPPWPLTELTPWHIDETMHKIDYDPAYVGLGNASDTAFGPGSGSIPSVLDQGPTAYVIGGSGSLSPGATVTNTTTAATTTNYTWTFTVRVILQRKRHLLWGAVPFGDPENRPNNITQLNALVGSNPEQNLFVNTAGTGTAAVVQSGQTVSVKAIYNLSYIDLLPPSVPQPPAPAVGYGLQLVPSSPSGMTAGNIYPMTHRTAMVYTAIHHILVNGELPIRSDYFGLWDDQDQQSARWVFDTNANTLQEYWTRYHRIYRRFPYTGVFTAELDDGVFPEVPSVTPYNGLVTPDASYAGAFNLPVTPAVTTALRIPTGTTLTNPYVRQYEYGLVRVPY